MSWCAETNHGQLGPGTELGIFEQPWAAGMPVCPLPSGVTLALRFPNGAVAKVDVIEVTATEAIIQTSNRAKWRMVRTEPKALRGLAPGTAGAPTTYWTVMDQIIEQGAPEPR